MPPLQDISGQRFGSLVAIRYIGKSKWVCRCDCGRETEVVAANLKRGHTKSCGRCSKTGENNANFLDLKGKRFGNLVAEEYIGNSKWRCVCDCGNATIVATESLTHSHTKSCGCLVHRTAHNRTHGSSKGDRLYVVWKSMRNRCYNKNTASYKDYGGRGITICEEWDDFAVFKEWALEAGYRYDAPSGECTIDRIDPNGNYCPENCRWVNRVIQARNKRIKGTNMRSWKPVALVDDKGAPIEKFPSISEASRVMGLNMGGIGAVCKGKKKSVAGNVFRFLDDKDRIVDDGRYGSLDDYKELSLSCEPFGTVLNEHINYRNSNDSVRVGDLVMFVSKDNYPFIDTGAVVGAGACGWGQSELYGDENITITVRLLNGVLCVVNLSDVQRV